MKTLRLIGTTLLMVVLCLNFTACGDDDDDDIDVSQLEGTWGLTHSAGWRLEETEKYEYRVDDTSITEDDDIDMRIEDEEQEEALANAEARLYTYNGYYVFFAKELVEVDIEAEIIITRTKLDTGEVQNNAS